MTDFEVEKGPDHAYEDADNEPRENEAKGGKGSNRYPACCAEPDTEQCCGEKG
jgi:hypothetical protein